MTRTPITLGRNPRRSQTAVLGRRTAGSLGVLVAAGTIASVGTFPPVISAATAAPAPVILYVEAQGSATGPCTQSQPCSELGRAVYVADHQAFDEAPTTIAVGPGTHVTHLDFPDAPTPRRR